MAVNPNKSIIFASICIACLFSNCSSPDIRLQKHSPDELASTKILDVRIERFKCSEMNILLALHSLFESLQGLGYKVSYGFNDEEAFKLASNKFVTIDLKNCDVRTALKAILLKAKLDYDVPKHAIMIDCADSFHTSSKSRETWAGTTNTEHRPVVGQKNE